MYQTINTAVTTLNATISSSIDAVQTTLQGNIDTLSASVNTRFTDAYTAITATAVAEANTAKVAAIADAKTYTDAQIATLMGVDSTTSQSLTNLINTVSAFQASDAADDLAMVQSIADNTANIATNTTAIASINTQLASLTANTFAGASEYVGATYEDNSKAFQLTYMDNGVQKTVLLPILVTTP